MKFLEILLSFMTHQGKSFVQTSSEAVSARVAENARRIAMLLSLTAIFITLFCSGFTMAYNAAIGDWDQRMGWSFAPAFIGGLILALIALSGLFYSLGEKRWREAVGADAHDAFPASPPPPPAGPSLESAFAVLLVEVINEFKERRKNAPGGSGETPQV